MALSIEIRSNYVYILEAKAKAGMVTLQKNHLFEFPEAWINDQGIIETHEFASLLKKELSEAGLTDKNVTLCINNGSILSRELVLPKVDPKRVPLLVRSELMSALNLTPNYIMDYIELEEFKEEDNSLLRVLAVAIPKSAVESYLNVMNACKLKTKVIDSATNAMIKFAMQSSFLPEEDQVIIADVGNGHLRLYLFENQHYVLTRNTKLNPYGSSNKEDVVEIIEDNLNKMIQFSFTRSSKSGVKQIILTGIDELLPDVKKNVEENLNVPCHVLEKPPFVSMQTDFEARYVNTIGVMLRK